MKHIQINNRDLYWDEINKSTVANIESKVAIVTGGGKGIGRAVVQNLLKNGAKVVIVSRTSGKELSNNINCFYKSCDVRDFKRVKDVVNEVQSEHGQIDILVNCAGYAFLTAIKEESEELFDKIMDINFKGVRNFIVACAPSLEKSKGSVVSIGSIWGLPGTNLEGDATYSAGDAAIIKYSEVAAAELKNVKINTISPALVDTSMNDDMTKEAREEFAKGYKNRSSLLEPEEIAEVVEFLVKSNLTQKNIIIDAGYTERIEIL